MAIKFMSLVELTQSKFLFSNPRKIFIERSESLLFRYTEIWSVVEGSKNIQLAYPKLAGYYHYPELVLVDVNFCVELWMIILLE